METNNKLREALIKIRDLTEPNEGVTEIELIINDIAISALAEPPRNCDIVPIEASGAADIFHRERPLHGYDYETHDWLLAPATEKEGGAK